jgi:hypothetical protein
MKEGEPVSRARQCISLRTWSSPRYTKESSGGYGPVVDDEIDEDGPA